MDNKENFGAIFKNNKRAENNSPDYAGQINVDGIEKRIALWVKTSKKGEKYFSAKISNPSNKEQTHKEEVKDDLPF